MENTSIDVTLQTVTSFMIPSQEQAQQPNKIISSHFLKKENKNKNTK